MVRRYDFVRATRLGHWNLNDATFCKATFIQFFLIARHPQTTIVLSALAALLFLVTSRRHATLEPSLLRHIAPQVECCNHYSTSSSFLLFFCKNYQSHHLGCSGKTSAFSHTLSWPAIAMAMSSHHRNAGLPSWTRPQFGRAPQRVALDPITQRSDRNGDGASASQQPGTPPQQVTIKFLQDQVSLLSSTPSRARSTLDLFSTGPFLSLAEVCEHCPSG